jgi:hypothetical protein
VIYVSSDVVLEDLTGDFRPNAPLVGYRQLLTLESMTSDEAAAGFPVTNLVNVSTAEKWKATTTGVQYVTVHLGTPGQADYIGIAAHNFGTAGVAVQLQTSTDGAVWTDLGDDFLPGDDSPIMARFDVTTASWWRLKLTPTSAAPEMAILYLGKLLVLQRNLYVGHTPMTYSYGGTISTGISESGQFLGAILRRQNPSTDVAQKNLTPSWFRTYLAPFFKKCSGVDTDRHRTPFFFAWRPTDYPVEVAFGWFPEGGAPSVSNARPNGMMDAAFPIQGIL